MIRPFSPRRAMTLIEVLAATVLLAILGSVCASLLRSVPAMTTEASQGDHAIDTMALERLADELIAEEDFRKRITADRTADFALAWPDEPQRPSVHIRRVALELSGDETNHGWIAFSCGQVIVWRCIELPEDTSSP